MSAPQSPTLTTTTIVDIVFAASTIGMLLFQMIIEVYETTEVDLAVWTHSVMA
jgi:hypothetical protein